MGTSDRPPFPLLQPEKVLSLPLDLRLTNDYRYRLIGTISRRTAMLCGSVRAGESGAIALQGHRLDRHEHSRGPGADRADTYGSPVNVGEEIQLFQPVKDQAGRHLAGSADHFNRSSSSRAGTCSSAVVSDYRVNS
jgi:hypothetical protein